MVSDGGGEDQCPTKSSAYTRFPRLVQTLFCYLTELSLKANVQVTSIFRLLASHKNMVTPDNTVVNIHVQAAS